MLAWDSGLAGWPVQTCVPLPARSPACTQKDASGSAAGGLESVWDLELDDDAVRGLDQKVGARVVGGSWTSGWGWAGAAQKALPE